jgi:hypothetical protein
VKRFFVALGAIVIVAAGVLGSGLPTHWWGLVKPQQSMTQSSAYRYGTIIGEMAYLDAMHLDGKTMAAAFCQEYTGGVTSSFIPGLALVEFPQWKNSAAKGDMGWFFLGVKAGCKT